MSPQLGKLVLLLSSSHDGEVVAAARAIDRVLKSNGRDWHDLAQALCPPDRSDWQRMAHYCHRRRHQLGSWEAEFIRSMLHWPREPSEKQQDLLASIFARLCSEAA
jgi:hypothetical protein